MELTGLSKSTGLLKLDDVLDFNSEESLKKFAADALQLRLKKVVLDFGSVHRMNSAGTGALVKLVESVRRQNMKLYARGLNQRYREIFNLIGLVEGITPLDEAFNRHDGLTEEEIGRLKELQSTEGRQDDKGWAQNVTRLHVKEIPSGAMNKNMNNRRVLGPLQGFGPMWQKTYLLDINKPELHPAEVIAAVKQHFPEFQPPQNTFFPTSKGISPGELVMIDSSTPGGIVSTGVLVLYADELSFTLMTPHGHPEAGWVTFSAWHIENAVRMQIQGLARASDPVFEVAFRIAGSKFQETIWKHVLSSLASYLNVEANVRIEKSCIGANWQWSKAGNIWYNAQIRSMPYNLTRLFQKTGKKSK